MKLAVILNTDFEPEAGETDSEFLLRIAPKLSRQEHGEALDLLELAVEHYYRSDGLQDNITEVIPYPGPAPRTDEFAGTNASSGEPPFAWQQLKFLDDGLPPEERAVSFLETFGCHPECPPARAKAIASWFLKTTPDTTPAPNDGAMITLSQLAHLPFTGEPAELDLDSTESLILRNLGYQVKALRLAGKGDTL
jgi:hypothetical protein